NGRLGTGVYFNGASAATLNNSAGVSSTKAVSIGLWVRPLALGTTGYLLAKQGAFAFPRLNADGSLDGQLSLSSGQTNIHIPNAARYNIWSYLVLTYDGANLKVYINGLLSGQQNATGLIQFSSASVSLGGGFNGVLDEITIDPYALSDSQVLARYQAAPPIP